MVHFQIVRVAQPTALTLRSGNSEINDHLFPISIMAAPNLNGAPLIDGNGSVPRLTGPGQQSQQIKTFSGSKMTDGSRKPAGSSEEPR